MQADISAVLADKAAALQAELLAKIQANLSGAVLQTRSGTLKDSIIAELQTHGDAVEAVITSVGVPYAAIQEEGGTTAAHDIVPVRAQALAFAGIFAKRVHHPGSVIPAHRYAGDALEAMRDDILGGLKAGVREALGA